MKGIFWNSRGLTDLAKRRFLVDASIEHKLDFIALSETGRDNFTSQFLGTLSGGVDFDWHCLPPRGRSGGILLWVKCDTLEVRNVVITTKKYTSVMIRVCHSMSRFLSSMYIHDKFMTESR